MPSSRKRRRRGIATEEFSTPCHRDTLIVAVVVVVTAGTTEKGVVLFLQWRGRAVVVDYHEQVLGHHRVI